MAVTAPGIDACGRHDAHRLDMGPTVLDLLGIEERGARHAVAAPGRLAGVGYG